VKIKAILKKWNALGNQKKHLNERGFTLTELLIVIAIIGMIATFVGSQVISQFNRAKVSSTKIQMRQLGASLDQYKLDCGFYPLSEQGLDALVSKPGGRECRNYNPDGYIRDGRVPRDGFDNEFLYESDGRTYLIKSLGNNNQPGGDGIDAEISSDDL
jgi:general secretion pathway protein G